MTSEHITTAISPFAFVAFEWLFPSMCPFMPLQMFLLGKSPIAKCTLFLFLFRILAHDFPTPWGEWFGRCDRIRCIRPELEKAQLIGFGAVYETLGGSSSRLVGCTDYYAAW